jgi:peptide/nickel transport system substrate-binding protein
MTMRGSKWLFAGLTMLAALAVTAPAAAENVLRYTSLTGGAVTVDPHANMNNAERAATQQAYEALLDIDSNLAIVPQLAGAWKILDPTHWQFELRPGVRFHDGTPFTAEDAVFSVGRARAKTSDVQESVANIAAVEAVGDLTVRIATNTPDPLLWMRLSSVAIMSERWAQAHNARVPVVVEAGEENFASRHANGTGPFVLEEFEPHGRWVMARNPNWWGEADYTHNIDRIVHTYKKNDEENLAALLNGEIDLLQGALYSGLDQIRRNPNLKLVHRPKLFTTFFGFDQVSQELRTSNIKGKNPFADKRVRQAIARSMELEAALRPLMGELFLPAGMLVAPGVNGYVPDLDHPPARDPDKAKALLVEAGYPDGFRVTLDCPSDQGDDDTTTCRAAAAQLDVIGIDVSLNFISTETQRSKVEQRRESDFFFDGWGMDLDSEQMLRDLFHAHGRYNMAGYANPRVDALLDKIKGEMVTYARDAYLEEAWRIVTGDLVYLPIRHGVSVFAMRKNLDIPPDPWDVPRFRLARFTAPSH